MPLVMNNLRIISVSCSHSRHSKCNYTDSENKPGFRLSCLCNHCSFSNTRKQICISKLTNTLERRHLYKILYITLSVVLELRNRFVLKAPAAFSLPAFLDNDENSTNPSCGSGGNQFHIPAECLLLCALPLRRRLQHVLLHLR